MCLFYSAEAVTRVAQVAQNQRGRTRVEIEKEGKENARDENLPGTL